MDVTRDPDRDDATLVDMIQQLRDDGYETQLIAIGAGGLRCAACDETTSADQIDVVGFVRVEAESDPDESSIVTWAACPNCGTRSIAVLGYGPAASQSDQSALARLDFDAINNSGPSATN